MKIGEIWIGCGPDNKHCEVIIKNIVWSESYNDELIYYEFVKGLNFSSSPPIVDRSHFVKHYTKAHNESR